MQAVIEDERMGPDPALARRIRLATVAVPTVALLAGAAAGIHHSEAVLVAVAVVFGWSQLAGA